MAYRGDFYVPRNIIGYTGRISFNPTVYFQNGDSFGHITQDHTCKENIGREGVFTASGYTIGNQGDTCVESVSGKVFHTSRSAFVAVNDMNNVHRTLLNLSIQRFKELKKIRTLRENEQRKVMNIHRITTYKVTQLSQVYGGQ